MDTFVSYLIRSALVSGLLLGYYHAVLRNRKIYSFNRVYLLMALVAGGLLPLVRLPWLNWRRIGQPILFVAHSRAHPEKTGGVPFAFIILFAGCLVSFVLMAVLIRRIAGVLRLRRGRRRVPVDGGFLFEVQDRRAPFSFLNNLFWKQGADVKDPVNKKIFDHEMAHIHGKHSYDSLFANALAALFWINPFYWAIRGELAMLHEFIADEASVGAEDTTGFAQMLLRAYDEGRYLDPSHRFFHSPIKRRLIMITKPRGPAQFRKWLALPVLLGVMMLSCTKNQTAGPVQSKKAMPLSLILSKIKKDSLGQATADQLKTYFFIRSKGAMGIDTLTLTMDAKDQKRLLDKLVSVPVVSGPQAEKSGPPPPPPTVSN